jgi:hypothetical protein
MFSDRLARHLGRLYEVNKRGDRAPLPRNEFFLPLDTWPRDVTIEVM